MSRPDLKLAEGARRGLRAPSGWWGEQGVVTAETAVVLPIIVAVVLGLVWLVSLGVTQIRVVDAARETARAVARDESPSLAVELGQRVAPEGARISISDQGDTVTVSVEADVRGPGGLFRFLPSVLVEAETVAAKESR